MEPATVPLTGNRWTPFVERFEIQGRDLTGATLAAAIRTTPDAPGAPLVALAGGVAAGAEGVRLAYAGSATVDAHLTAGRLSVVPNGMAGTDTLALTLIDMRINEATMEDPAKIPFPGERGDEAVLHWDMHITPTGEDKQVWFRGAFNVRPGVVQ